MCDLIYALADWMDDARETFWEHVDWCADVRDPITNERIGRPPFTTAPKKLNDD